MQKAERVAKRALHEEKSLAAKSKRTGIPVSQLKKPKHKANGAKRAK